MRIFLLEEPRRHLDLASASAFGEIKYLFKPDTRRSSVFNVQVYVEEIVKALDEVEFDPSQDAFCIAGGMLNVAMAMTALTHYATTGGHPELSLLMFNSSNNGYVLRRLNVLALTP